MTRTSHRYREHTLRPDRHADAEPFTFTMQCAACEETGPTSTDAEDGTAWAAQHLKAKPQHLVYREHITRPYRFESGAWK